MDFIIVEDHELVREGVAKLVEEKSGYRCAGKCSNISDTMLLVRKYQKQNQNVFCLVDINLGQEDGLDLIRQCAEEYKNALCIAYTMYSGAGIIKMAIEAGARAYVSKNAEINELLVAFEKVLSGESFYLESGLAQNFFVFSSLLKSLTKREIEVFNMLLKKMSSKEIAQTLQINIRTAENYFSRIYDKLGVADKDELVKEFG